MVSLERTYVTLCLQSLLLLVCSALGLIWYGAVTTPTAWGAIGSGCVFAGLGALLVIIFVCRWSKHE